MKNRKSNLKNILAAFFAACLSAGFAVAQEKPPAPGAPKSVAVPAVAEKTLANKLKVVVIERKNVPLVTVQLLIRSGAQNEPMEKAGLANMTASLLTKGTKTRAATEIAEQMEFLGGSISTGAGWNNSVVVVNVMADKLDPALAIMADAVLAPVFSQEEIDLLKSQTLDSLAYNLKQPGFLAGYVAAGYSYGEHPAGGTPNSISAVKQADIAEFHRRHYEPTNAVLIFTGDIAPAKANALAAKYFGKWKAPARAPGSASASGGGAGSVSEKEIVERILVVDLPNAGQAAVSFNKRLAGQGRTSDGFYTASVLNSLLGGGYSSRLNQEIRIKRGLSYGAGSSFSWRANQSIFGTRTQTKNESAAEVAELVVKEIKKLSEGQIPDTELGPRKMVLTGDFGRDLETTGGLAGAVADLYSFGLPTTRLNAYMNSVQAVSDRQIRDFAGANLKGGDLVIVGDAEKFIADLKKRFPKTPISTVKADELDASRPNLTK